MEMYLNLTVEDPTRMNNFTILSSVKMFLFNLRVKQQL